jgi:hypothetical protein
VFLVWQFFFGTLLILLFLVYIYYNVSFIGFQLWVRLVIKEMYFSGTIAFSNKWMRSVAKNTVHLLFYSRTNPVYRYYIFVAARIL